MTAQKKIAKKTSNDWTHFLQTEEWGDIKKSASWSVKTIIFEAKSLGISIPLVAYSRTALGLGKIHYIPKLSQLSSKDAPAFTKLIRDNFKRGICVKVEIDQAFDEATHHKLLNEGWVKDSSIQYEETVLVDLKPTEDDIFMSFKTRARWEIRAAQRRGATVERVDCTEQNMQIMIDMLKVTAVRGNFSIRKEKFLKKYWKHFAKLGLGYIYFVRHEDDILCAVYIMRIGNRAYYKDGASIRKKSNLFGSRLLHWQVMKDMKAQGATTYDMCGVMATHGKDDRNKGILTFKTGFGEVTASQGSYVLPISAKKFNIWQKVEPKYVALYFKIMKDLWY